MRVLIVCLLGLILMGINIKNQGKLKEFQGTFVEKNSRFFFGMVLVISEILILLDKKHDFNFWIVSSLTLLMLTLAISLLSPLEKQKIYLDKYKKYSSK